MIDGMHIAALPLEVTVPSLVETWQGDDPIARLSAVKTLGRFSPMAEPAVPALIAALKDEFEDVRKEAATALGKIGPAAKDAIPALEVLQEEALQEESLVDFYTKEAIRRITGD